MVDGPDGAGRLQVCAFYLTKLRGLDVAVVLTARGVHERVRGTTCGVVGPYVGCGLASGQICWRVCAYVGSRLARWRPRRAVSR